MLLSKFDPEIEKLGPSPVDWAVRQGPKAKAVPNKTEVWAVHLTGVERRILAWTVLALASTTRELLAISTHGSRPTLIAWTTWNG